ncbi:minor head protein [Planktothrix phage PaV-LD]|uniref:minor head protein n=1 Tax=Planktothrix phage PaV-LD TaxID=994601 RepID=UPI000243C911|nr:minor head protein [Planktothrix phage PaV-LD]ADZ31573.1 hypothetical protein PaVLD_ORF066R [Planktothrix phage PaV-LD]
MVAKSGKIITKKEAQDTVDAIADWTNGSDPIRDDQKAGRFNQQAEYLSSYINNSVPYKGDVYRGLNFSSEKEALDWIKGVGHVLDNQSAHASWTSDVDVAELFGNQDGASGQMVVLKAVNRTGVSIQNIAESTVGAKAMEVIVSKNARHRVKNIVKEEYDGSITVEVEEI